ncbi:MAG: aldo/keto reductase [Phycisphaerae bacterium]
MQELTLISGDTIPQLGLGTWPLKGDEGARVIAKALEMGYRHLDTAVFYGNHHSVGQGIRDAAVDRDEVFVTSKVWPDKLAYDDVLSECERSLKELGLQTLDLLLIHWPSQTVPLEETLRAYAHLREEGKIRHAGVSNFTAARLGRAIDADIVPIEVNQVEYHVYLNQQKLLDFCRSRGVVLTAYAPLAKGRAAGDELLREIGRAYRKAPAQVALRWLVQKGICVIPKSSNEEHLRQNMDIFDWSLTEEDVQRIEADLPQTRLFDWEQGEFEEDED